MEETQMFTVGNVLALGKLNCDHFKSNYKSREQSIWLIEQMEQLVSAIEISLDVHQCHASVQFIHKALI